MRRPNILRLPIVGFVLFTIPGFGQNTSVGLQDVRRLETELSLARSPAFYFILNIKARTLELKARGIVLRGWPLGDIRQSGLRAAEGIHSIEKKAAPFVPTRSKIIPEKADEEPPAKPEETKKATSTDAYDLQALEVQDMPERFSLALDSGLTIQFRPQKRGVSSIFGRAGRALYLPLITLFMTLKKKRFSTLELQFADKIEVQALYWIISEGQNIFIINN